MKTKRQIAYELTRLFMDDMKRRTNAMQQVGEGWQLFQECYEEYKACETLEEKVNKVRYRRYDSKLTHLERRIENEDARNIVQKLGSAIYELRYDAENKLEHGECTTTL